MQTLQAYHLLLTVAHLQEWRFCVVHEQQHPVLIVVIKLKGHLWGARRTNVSVKLT